MNAGHSPVAMGHNHRTPVQPCGGASAAIVQMILCLGRKRSGEMLVNAIDLDLILLKYLLLASTGTKQVSNSAVT